MTDDHAEGASLSPRADLTVMASEAALAIAQANGPDSREAKAERERVLLVSTQHQPEPPPAEVQFPGEPT